MPKPPAWTDSEVQQLLDMKARGMRERDIADAMGRTVCSVNAKVRNMAAPSRKLNIPPDFATFYRDHPVWQITEKYGFSAETIRRYARYLGLPSKADQKKQIVVPEGFAKMAETMTLRAVRKALGVGHERIKLIYEAAGIKPRGKIGLQIPDNFDALAARLPIEALARETGLSSTTCRRLRAERGIKPPHIINPTHGRVYSITAKLIRNNDGSRAYWAAQHLRSRGYIISKVEYSDESYRKKYPRSHYVVGRFGVMSPDELLSFAIERGYDPDAWKKIA